MAILGKDLLDLHRPHTNTRVEFGASCYWVESAPEPQPYGAILTEVLNLDAVPFQRLLNRLNLVIQQQDLGAAPRAYMEMKKGFGSLPLYRLYLEDFRACDDMEAEDFAVAEQIDERGLGAFISGVSLGENPEVDPPQVRSQYRLRGQGREAEIVERMYFGRLLDFVYVELMKGMQKGFVPKRCANCGRWFLQMPGATYSYCDGPAPGQEGKTCREIGAAASFQDKVRNNGIWKIHQRAYKKYFARTRKGTMSRAEFDIWAREAEQLRDQALAAYEGMADGNAKAEIADRLKQKLNQN